ncbi:unnamed protein product [Notodromas monacha]|uniref:Uncharacterized protein n=1 Tax=Notodromas monacha TaxID=399045 RepID=A0A7R9BXD0_9CRUS|nr:unnamed protein product [Notodromas monacha]CAG0922408.1 unnamed protein product [Notodromas monacha]
MENLRSFRRLRVCKPTANIDIIEFKEPEEPGFPISSSISIEEKFSLLSCFLVSKHFPQLHQAGLLAKENSKSYIRSREEKGELLREDDDERGSSISIEEKFSLLSCFLVSKHFPQLHQAGLLAKENSKSYIRSREEKGELLREDDDERGSASMEATEPQVSNPAFILLAAAAPLVLIFAAGTAVWCLCRRKSTGVEIDPENSEGVKGNIRRLSVTAHGHNDPASEQFQPFLTRNLSNESQQIAMEYHQQNNQCSVAGRQGFDRDSVSSDTSVHSSNGGRRQQQQQPHGNGIDNSVGPVCPVATTSGVKISKSGRGRFAQRELVVKVNSGFDLRT